MWQGGTMHTCVCWLQLQPKHEQTEIGIFSEHNFIGYNEYKWVQIQFAHIDTEALTHAAMHTVTHNQQKCLIHGHR
jgi:hypothetical protein